MFKTKKDVDRHVRTALSKLRSETEKSLRGFTIAKLYYKINEYSTSQHYISSFLSVKEDSAPAHKLLGQCYLQLKKPDKALSSFQRSLQLDPKQHDLLIEVCKLLLNDNSINLNKAKYWCDLAENEKVQHDAIFSLRLKLLNKDSLETKQVEELILKEISSRPADVNLRVRLVRHFIEQNKLVDAFKYAFDLQMKNYDLFSSSGEWYNVVGLVLNKYKQIVKKKTWDFWLLLIMCYEKQVEISFSITTESMPNAGTTELANLLFNFDQCLFEASLCLSNDCNERELVTEFMRHYRGQFCLYAAALLYKREIVQNKNHWQETTKNALPLLILAFQCGAPDTQELWLKHSRDQTKQLIQLWNREGAFRCSQAGRTLLSCVEAPIDSSVSSQVQQILSESRCWSSTDDILSQVRQYCLDNAWRHKLFRILFPNSDHIIKMQSSLLINCQELAEPNYEIPSYADVESYEEIAQYLRPQSLQHMVYLCLGSENLANIRCKFFSGLNFSTQNLSFCGAESLNQLDIETFLYGTAIQAQRAIDIEKTFTDNYNSKNCGKPKILPFVNVVTSLCTEEQMTWWLYAYQVYKNLINDNLAEVRATLQYGIEAVRGINGPKIDLIIVLRLGKIFDTRSQDSMKPMEKKFLEIRVETLYKYGLNMLKLHNKGVLEPYRKLFKFSNSNSSQVEREINSLAEEAITHLAARYFKNSEYEECIEELSGIQLPFATYFQAEAYRKLDESNKTPKKTKKIYLDKARDCLNQTLNLLGNSNISTNHPLNSVVHSEIKRLQYTNKFSNDTFNHGTYVENTDDFLNETPTNYNSNYNNRLRRADVLTSPPRSVELENLVKQMATTLTFLKEEFIDIIKPEVVGIKKELTTLKEKLETMEENMKKKSNPPSRDDDPSDLNDLYIMDDELQNQIYGNQHNMYPNYGQQQPIQHPQHSIRTPPNTLMNQPSQHHATVVPSHHQAQQPNTYSSPMYNPGYSMNYFPQYVMPGTHPAPPPLQTAQRSALGINQHSMPFVDHGLNFNLAGQQPAAQQIQLPPPDNRSNLFGLLTQTSNTQERIQTNQPLASSTPNMWNRLYNSGPVEKGPPVNVVITSSDPLPTNTISLAQPTLSVTIPPQHIKSSTVSNEPLLLPPLQQPSQHNTNFPIITNSIPSVSIGLTSTVSAIPIGSLSSLSKNNLQQTMKSPEVYSTRASDSIGSDTHNRSGDSEYDPRPDFKPVIPLPKEIDVKTGEEDEDVLFCCRAKLFRYIDKEWKERGLGDMKILRNTNDGKIRILMRREQTHKICANHIITEEMCLTQAKNEERSYIWAANDYADEELKVEKLCVRFKHADSAKEFYNVFKKAQDAAKKQAITSGGDKNKKESENNSQITINPMLKSSTFNFSKIITPTESNTNNSASAGFATKTNLVISTPAAIGAKDISVETKSSPFTGFSFKPTAAGTPELVTPFANIFPTLNKTSPLEVTSSQNRSDTISSHTTKKDDSVNKSTSETEDDYVPTAQFKPVIPLPDLVEMQTGEENEIVLFEHRAKLLRYDKESSQWKERGIGNMKILADKENTDLVRLVMRRETVHKLCCNQRLNKSMKFKKSPNTDCALSWCGQDFSENELNTELLTIRFKTAEICSAFHKAILEAQANMPDNFVELNPDSKSKVSQRTQGFGNIFKPEPGSWNCRACYVQNLAIAKDCVACGSLRDNDTKKIEGTKKSEKTFTFGIKPTSDQKKNEGFGDKFKLKPGSWNCVACYVTNQADVKKCLACDTLRDKQIVHKESAKKAGNTITACVKTDEKVVESFGDKFKPKPGSWTCKACYLSNASDALYCIACENPKDDTVPKKNSTQTNIFSNLGIDAPKTTFTFGFASNKQAKDITMQKTDSSKNVFGAVSSCPSSKFTFGTNANTTGTITDLSKTSEAPITATYTFGRTTTTMSEGASTGFSFGLISSTDPTKIQPSNLSSTAVGEITTFDNSKISSQHTTLPTFSFPSSATSILGMSKSAESNKTTGTAFSETSLSSNMSKQNIDIVDTDEDDQFKLEKKDFQFVLKVKSPGKVKSPLKIGDEYDLDDVEEENSTYFTPVIPLPDKIEVKTGEEDEKELYCHRAKLFRFVETENGMEWKERGLGDVKILKHRKTEKLRVVMRREKILKICLNHVLNGDIEYKRKDDKSWHFIVNDYSEGEIEKIHFCLRFKSGEVAEEFMEAVQKSIAGEIIPEKEQALNDNQPKLEDKHNISEEDRELADRLQLPENFFNKSIANCSGCPGCDPDSFVFPVYNAVNKDFIDDDPIPLELEYEPISRKSESSTVKHTSFSFVTPPKSSSDSSTNPFRSPNIFQNNQYENKILTDQGEQQINKFVLPLKNLEEQDDNKEKPDEGKFVSGGFLFGNAGNSFADKAKPSFGSSGLSIFGATKCQNEESLDKPSVFGGGLNSIFGATKCQNEESLDKPPVTNISFKQHTPLNEVNNKNSSTKTGSQQEFMFDNKIGIEGITSESSTPITDKNVQNTSDQKNFGDNPSSKSTFFFGGVAIFADVTPTFGITNQGNIFGGFKQSESTPESILARQPRKGLGLPIFSGSNLTFPNANEDSDLSSNMDTIIKESSTDKIVPINMFSNSSPASESSNLIQKEINSSLSPTTSKDSSIITSDPLTSCLSGGDTKKELDSTEEEEPIFKMNDNISFAALAQATTGNGTFRTIENTAEFVGLTNTNAFSSFLNPQTGKEKTVNALNLSPGGDTAKQDDNTYDPHYDPVIELPKEIEVRTGEEDETKLFGDRGTLYRYDSTSKEWKERGVGEMKILHHSENGTYRLLLRRELIYKTVLNHAITSDFKISPMGKNGKAFLWAAKNFAEAEQPAEFEKLAIKFSNINVASRFEKEIKKCIAELAKRAGLEPEED